jgi:hypothetical protein
LKFGAPIPYETFSHLDEDKDKYQKISEMIFDRITDMID